MEQLKLNFTANNRQFLPLLTPDEIYENANQSLLSKLKEDRRIERKTAGIHAKQLGEYFSMWANTVFEGGLLALGIENKKLFTGCEKLSTSDLNNKEKAPYTYCPDSRTESKRVRVINSEGNEDYVVLFRTPYREDKLVKDVSGDAYIRKGDSKHKMTADEMREFQIDKKQIDLEQEPANLVFPQDLRSDIIERYVEGVHRIRSLSQRHSTEEILQLTRLGKIINNNFIPNNACALLFAKEPNLYFPGCSIRFLRYEGETEQTGKDYNVVKDIWLEGCVPELIVNSANAVQSQLREFTRMGNDGKFYTAPEYPEEAWYEAIVNACVHRSYGLKNMNIFIKMFDDKVIIESPGPFPPLVTPQNIYRAHNPRNPHLMRAMFYLDFVKCANEGTRRMRDTMEEMKLPHPEFKQTEENTGNLTVRVILRNNRKQRKIWIDSNVLCYIPYEIAEKLTIEERRIINFIGENGQIKVVETHRLLQPTIKTWHTVKKLLIRLCERGILIHIHSNKIERDSKAYFTFCQNIHELND